MAGNAMRITQVAPSDSGGGAQRVALDLHHEYIRRGLDASHIVGRCIHPDSGCIELDNDAYRGPLTRLVVRRLPPPEDGLRLTMRQAGRSLIEPGRALAHALGWDDYDYPATRRIPSLVSPGPDVLHLHNLHGGFFDLRALPALSRRYCTVVTLHDTWLLSGHCAYSLDCDSWLTGCGNCPHPKVPAQMINDGSAHNWRRKRDIYRRCRLHVVGCSQWVLDLAQRSILAPAIVSATVINNGIDQDAFRPGAKSMAREALGIPSNVRVVAFAANGLENPFKDFATLLQALAGAANALLPQPVLLLAIGAHAAVPGIDPRLVRVVPFMEDTRELAVHLRASDLFVLATRADNFPLTVLEAQSCGVPALVTDVGGVPETIDDGVTGRLYPPGDVTTLARAIAEMLADPARLEEMGRAAIARARPRFSVPRMADDYLALYELARAEFASRSA